MRTRKSRVRSRRTAEATPSQRLGCLRELHRLELEQRIIDRLVSGILPNELVMRILAEVVHIRMPKLYISHEPILSAAIIALLGEYWRGQWPAAKSLHPLIRQALLENADILLDVSFARREQYGTDPVARLPAFVPRLPHSIRHLQLYCKTDIPLNRLTYPIEIFKFTRGIGSLREHFANLHTLILVLNLHVYENFSEHVLDQGCFYGYSQTAPFSAVLVWLIEAVREDGPGRSKVVRIEYEDNMRCKYHGPETIIAPSTGSAEEVLREANKVIPERDPRAENEREGGVMRGEDLWTSFVAARSRYADMDSVIHNTEGEVEEGGGGGRESVRDGYHAI